MMKMWVHLLCLLLVGLNVCTAASLMSRNKELNIAQPQNSKSEVAIKEAAEILKPCNTSENLLEFRVGKIRTGGDAEHESVGFKVQGLSTSESSPAVGHMEIYGIADLGQTGEVGHQEQDVSQKRVLKSTPSPGAGH